MNKLILFLAVLLLSFTVNGQEPDQNEPVIQGNEDQHAGNEERREGETD